MGTAILCQTGLSRHLQLSVRVPGCQKLQTTAESGLAQDAVPLWQQWPRQRLNKPCPSSCIIRQLVDEPWQQV